MGEKEALHYCTLEVLYNFIILQWKILVLLFYVFNFHDMIVMILFILWSKMEPFLIVLALSPPNIMNVHNANTVISSMFSRTLICTFLSQTVLGWGFPLLLVYFLLINFTTCLLVTLFIMLPYPPFTTKHNANFSMTPSLLLVMLLAWLWTQKDYRYYNFIFKYLCISHHVEFWNHQPVYCLWSLNQSSSNPLYSLILLSPSIASPQKSLVGMPAQGILLFRSFSMYLMCLILILLIYTILSLPKLLVFVALGKSFFLSP